MEVSTAIDWISATYKSATIAGIGTAGIARLIQKSDLPAFQVMTWKISKARNGYTDAMESNTGIIIMSNIDRPDMGVHIVMSGGTLRRCQDMQLTPTDILHWLLRNDYRLSRLDIAVDAYDSGLEIEQLADAVTGGTVKTRARKAPYVDDKMGKGKTQYVGSMKKRKKLFRAYDKAVEQGVDGMDWKRFELELHGNSASVARNEILKPQPMGKTIQALIIGYVNFPEIREWVSIMGEDELKIGVPMDAGGDTHKWLLTQVAPALARILDEDEAFMYKFMEVVGENRK